MRLGSWLRKALSGPHAGRHRAPGPLVIPPWSQTPRTAGAYRRDRLADARDQINARTQGDDPEWAAALRAIATRRSAVPTC